MKVAEKINKDNFTPVTLEITIETEEEFLELYDRVNCNYDDIKQKLKDNAVGYFETDGCFLLFKEINKIREAKEL